MSEALDIAKNNPNREKQMNWLSHHVGHDSYRQFALRLGLSPRTVANWARRESLPAGGVLDITDRLGIDPVQALVDTGYLDERRYWTPQPALKSLTNRELADEISERFDARTANAIRVLMGEG